MPGTMQEKIRKESGRMKAEKKKTAAYYILPLLSMLAGVALDQWTKHLVAEHLKGQPPVKLIPGIFELTYLENRGAAFGILQNQQWFFIISTTAVLIAVAIFYVKASPDKKFHPLRMLAVLVAAGAIGNLIDRIRLHYVVDFFYFKIIDFPVFNVADIYVTVSVFILVILILFYYKEEDLGEIFHR